jgi:hypothetical protein
VSEQQRPTETQLDPDLYPEGPVALNKDYGLLRKVLVYHVVVAIILMTLGLAVPGFVDFLPVGGVDQLLERTDHLGLPTGPMRIEDPPVVQSEIVNTVIRATTQFDRLGYARQLAIILVGVWLLMLPVSWVHKGIHRASLHDHSLDETTLVLPGIVAAIVLVVQHSLALAFSLAGIVAGVHFRRALQDTFDALFILVAIGTGIAAGVEALEIATVLTLFFCYASLYVYYVGDGLESHHEARRKAIKQARKRAEVERRDS